MPKPDDRGSLMNLKASLPRVAPIEATEEMERRIMGSNDGDKPAHPHIQTAGRKDVSTYSGGSTVEANSPAVVSAARIPRREGTILLNAKIPVSLHTRLKRTAQYNDISMTDILLRGLESELNSGRYSLPPGTWGTDEPD